MDGLKIEGGKPLRGDIAISGAKNAALPLLCLGLMTSDRLVLENVPRLADTVSMEGLLRHHGVTVDREGEIVTMQGGATRFDAPYVLVRKMRASVLVLGPLLACYGEARVSLPGGVLLVRALLTFTFGRCRVLVQWLNLQMVIFKLVHLKG